MALSTPALGLLARHSLHPDAIVLDNGTTLTLLKDVRLVPTRRLVCEATWQNRTVFAKFFLVNAHMIMRVVTSRALPHCKHRRFSRQIY